MKGDFHVIYIQDTVLPSLNSNLTQGSISIYNSEIGTADVTTYAGFVNVISKVPIDLYEILTHDQQFEQIGMNLMYTVPNDNACLASPVAPIFLSSSSSTVYLYLQSK